MDHYWSRARYDFGLSDREFYRLTPKQFGLLAERHRDTLVHRELLAAWTTTAVINWSMSRPDEPVPATAYMPSYRQQHEAVEASQDQLQAQSDYNLKVAELAAQMKAGKGDLYESICLQGKPDGRPASPQRKARQRKGPCSAESRA